MNKSHRTRRQLLDELQNLTSRMMESEETLRAIRGGEVDGLVVSTAGGDQVFTLMGAEHPYRVMVETMNEGAVTLASDGTIIFCNQRFAEIVKRSLETVIGSSIYHYISSKDHQSFEGLIEQGLQRKCKAEMALQSEGENSTPVLLSISTHQHTNIPSMLCMIVTDLTDQKHNEEILKDSRERLRNLTKHLQKTREQERAFLSRELHDELGQILTGMKMDIRWIEKRLPEDSTLILERLNSIIMLIDDAILFVQKISMLLRPPDLDDFGLSEAIKLVLTNFEEKTNITCKFISTPQQIVLNREISTEIFRIFQEAFTNITRHADAKNVTILLQHMGNRLTMEIGDDGRGITKKETMDHKSIGLTGMRERAYAMEGNLTIIGMRGKGTTITLSVPLNEGKEKILNNKAWPEETLEEV
jgi:PAS domain S-box-containing protein